MIVIVCIMAFLDLGLIITSLTLAISRRNAVFVTVFMLSLIPSFREIGLYAINIIWPPSVTDVSNIDARYWLEVIVNISRFLLYFVIIYQLYRTIPPRKEVVKSGQAK